MLGRGRDSSREPEGEEVERDFTAFQHVHEDAGSACLKSARLTERTEELVHMLDVLKTTRDRFCGHLSQGGRARGRETGSAPLHRSLVSVRLGEDVEDAAQTTEGY